MHEPGIAQQRHSPEHHQHQEHAAQEGEQQNRRNRNNRSLNENESHEGHNDGGSGKHEKRNARQGDADEAGYQQAGEHLVASQDSGEIVQHAAEAQVVEMGGDCLVDRVPWTNIGYRHISWVSFIVEILP